MKAKRQSVVNITFQQKGLQLCLLFYNCLLSIHFATVENMLNDVVWLLFTHHKEQIAFRLIAQRIAQKLGLRTTQLKALSLTPLS